MKRFVDNVVIITGGSIGIGKAISFSYAKEGAKIVIVARNKDILDKTLNEFISQGIKSSHILTIPIDVSKEGASKIIIEKTIEKFNKLNILVNNAGVNGKPGISNLHSMELYDYINNINVRAVISLSEEAIPYLSKTKGNIINISSISSTVPTRTTTYYSMSKASIDIYTQALGGRLAYKGIRVNSINPGFIETSIFTKSPTQEGTNISEKEMIDKMMETVGDKIPLKRFGKPDDIAKFVLFISSDDASYSTGCNYLVDGGLKVIPSSLKSLNFKL
uniref:SDR family oxidoreductase n=1 Tax=Parastrongyloides trichosuri TaxID=131310 RepID=A0A0N4ZI33_PARTI